MQIIHRLPELDWLRVILILAVFGHHVFMPFNGDEWHVMNKESSKMLDDIMVYFEQIRLQTLFFIAGVGSFILLQKTSTLTFLKGKFFRLFIPLIVGMMFIVPPQHYYENMGEYTSLLAAYEVRIFAFDSKHLWFIEFLIIFMVLAIPFQRFLACRAGVCVSHALSGFYEKKHGLFANVILLILMRCTLKYFVPEQNHSIHNLSVTLFYLFFFIAGMCFITRKEIWQFIALHRRTNLMWFVISSVLFYGYYFSPDLSSYLSLEIRWQLWWIVCSLVSWSGLLTVVGYASTYCNKTPKWLEKANELIYPFYIFHQTIIVALGFYIVQWEASIAIKSTLLLLSSFFICALICYYFVRPFKVLRFLFGLKGR